MVTVTTVVSPKFPFLTVGHIEEWAALGPPSHQRPTSKDEQAALQERRQQRNELKQKLLKLGPEETSPKLLERELNRCAQYLWDFQTDDSNNNAWRLHLFSQQDNRPAYQQDPSHPDNIMDYRSEGGPLLQYLWAPNDQPIQGQSLYLGGEVGSDGNIYCIPGHAERVLKIDTHNNTIEPIGPKLNTRNGRLFKWLRGIVVDNIIYGLPCHADSILRIDVKTQTVSQIPIPFQDFYSDPQQAKEQRCVNWKYHGGSICPLDGCIYAIPQAAHRVLKLDPTTETISLVGPELPGKCKWYGGIVGKSDGAIYGIPQNAAGVLRITPTKVTVHGDFGQGQHNWHGGAAAGNGVIVSVPANADTVLCITPADTQDGEPTLREIGNSSFIQSGRHRSDGKYKYLGAMAGTNGKVYIFPCASEYVLQVDTLHFVAKNVGPNLRETGMESVHQNKWQNGLTCLQDQCVYGMPLSGHTLLRIDCSETTADEDSPDPVVTTWKLPSPRIECRDKFEGGVYTDSGIMYTVPNNHKGVLRIEPANLASKH